MAENIDTSDPIFATSKPLEASSIIINTPVNEHLLVVYDSLESFRELYIELGKRLIEKKNELLVILTYYETPDNIRLFLKERGVNVAERQRECSLLIIDSVRWFSGYPVPDSSVNRDVFVRDLIKTAKE